jgi:RNA polymerase-binding transcription factor DksA
MAQASEAVVRARLAEERDRIREQLNELGLGPNGSLSFDEGFADSSQVTAERGEIEALVGSLTDTLKDIEDGLKKLDDGSYGRCESCGGEISEARLEAMPAARLCITCASKSR